MPFGDAQRESAPQSHPAGQIHSSAGPAPPVARPACLAGGPSGSEANQSAPDRQPAIPARRHALPASPDPEVSATSPVGVPRVVDRCDEVTTTVPYVIWLCGVEVLGVVFGVGQPWHRGPEALDLVVSHHVDPLSSSLSRC